jgi:hypothetical protein
MMFVKHSPDRLHPGAVQKKVVHRLVHREKSTLPGFMVHTLEFLPHVFPNTGTLCCAFPSPCPSQQYAGFMFYLNELN